MEPRDAGPDLGDKQVLFQRLDHQNGRVRAVAHDVADRRIDVFEQRGIQQKRPHHRSLSIEHLLGQVLIDYPWRTWIGQRI